MLRGGIGLLRTMPAPKPEAVARAAAVAAGLGLHVARRSASVGRVLAERRPLHPRGAAFVDQAAELMRGAGYTAFDGEPPAEPDTVRSAAPYAHVTAPLRRLADRYATEVCLSLRRGPRGAGVGPCGAAPAARRDGPSGRRASAAERGAIDLAEAVLLADRVGEEFDAAVLDVDGRPQPGRNGRPERPPTGTVALDEPPVRARCEGTLRLGERVRVRLVKADPARRTVQFEAGHDPLRRVGR